MRSNLLVPVIGLIALVMPRAHGQASESANALHPLFELAVQRATTLRYVGKRMVTLLEGGDGTPTLEYVTRDGLRLRIDYPNDSPFAGHVILETLKERRHFIPNENIVRQLPPRRAEALNRLAMMIRRPGSRFRQLVENGPTIAGRATRELSIADGRGRTLQRLAIDPTTGAVLRSEVYNPRGDLLGRFEFREIEFRDRIDPSLFRLNVKGARTVNPRDEAVRLARQYKFVPVFIPAETGYRLESSRIVRPMGRVTLVQSYVGGAGRLTFFQTNETIDPERLGRLGREDLKLETWRLGKRSFALIGGKADDVVRIAALMKRAAEREMQLR
ncbi:MAG: hypothetical protein SFX74_08240 [Fimbriimonadaceae bacterium]|nr:hypothetical protein [Fimbriimonadaceae bacterium]